MKYTTSKHSDTLNRAAAKDGEADPALAQMNEMLDKENEAIRHQRLGRGISPNNAPLTGLALSGGGIRSATFALGVMQKLRKLGLLKHIDYLSTVSGGGYIGAWLLACRHHEAAAGRNGNDDFLNDDSNHVHHLRRYSRYLTPRTGLLSADTWTAVTIWVRNTASMQLLLGLFLCLLLLLPRLMSCAFECLAYFSYGHSPSFLMALLVVLALICVLHMSRLGSLFKDADKARQSNMSEACIVLAAVAGAFMLAPALWSLAHIDRIESHSSMQIMTAGLMITAAVLGLRIYCMLVIGRSTNGWPARLAEHCQNIPAYLPALWRWVLGSLDAAERKKTFFKLDHDLRWVGAKLLSLTAQFVLTLACSVVLCVGLLAAFRMFPQPPPPPPYDLMLSGMSLPGTSSFMAWAPTLFVRDSHFLSNLELSRTYKIFPLESSLAMQISSAVGMPLVLLGFATLIGFGIAVSGADIPSRLREWWARIAAWLVMASVGWCLLGLFCFLGPLAVQYLAEEARKGLTWKALLAALTWVAPTVAGLVAGRSEKTQSSAGESKQLELAAAVAPVAFATGLMLVLSFLSQLLVGWVHALPCMQQGGQVEACAREVGRWLHCEHVQPYLQDLALCLNKPQFFTVFSTSAAVLVLLVMLASLFDINELSMNQFYRNRLMRCYLGGARPGERRPHPFTGFDFDDDVAMRDLSTHENSTKFKGPFWIVNTALNTAKEPDLDVAERQAESFIFTPLHCGFYRKSFGSEARKRDPDLVLQGYQSLEHYTFTAGTSRHSKEKGITAAFAVAASGAAVSPNSGYHTSPLTSFLMTLFNVRLGWWVPNPIKGGWMHHQPWAMSRFALRELFGVASAGDDCVYLSDGGHFENLGLYELVRRKCGLIIVSDGEQDEHYSFHALGTAIRRCWVDLRARIEIDVTHIKPKTPDGTCGSHCAIGKIYYDADGDTASREPDAWLVYLKLSLTGDEDTDLLQYKTFNPSFPHDQTADQWFSESQFESYRKLGLHVADTALSSTLEYLRLSQQKLDKLGIELARYWTPPAATGTSAFIENTDALMQIWKDVAHDTHLKFLDPLVLPLPVRKPKQLQKRTRKIIRHIQIPKVGSDEERAGRYLCQRLFQLMENVYLDLNLARNRSHPDDSGWMELFQHWMQFAYFRNEWDRCKETYGKRFQAFWTQSLSKVDEEEP